MIKALSKFIFNVFLISIILITITILIGRNHFLLGSILNFSRILLIIIFTILITFTIKKKIKIICGILLILLTLDFLIVNINYERGRYLDYLQSTEFINNEITLLTYNLYFKNRNPLASIKEIKKVNPDLLIVQELTPKWKEIIKSNLTEYKHKSIKPLRGTHGLGIYSKYPIKDVKFINNSKGLPIAQIAVIQIKKDQIELCNVHLVSPAIAVENPDRFWEHYSINYQNRKKQFRKLNKYLSSNKGIKKQILIGDLNTIHYEPLYNEIRNDWIDLFTEQGKGSRYSFPNSSKYPFPFLTLDYIFIKGEVSGIKSKVVKGGSSDHLGVMGIIEI